MIRKIGAVNVPPAEALKILLDIESWGEWVPSIDSARVLERSEQRIVAEIFREEYRRIHRVKMEFLLHPHGYTERQIEGLAKRWEGQWSFRPSPDGRGSIVTCSQEFDLGLLGFFVSRRLIQRTVDRTFEGILRGIDARASARALEHRQREARSPLTGVDRIQVFSTPAGLEIWLDDRRYLARRVD